MCRPVLAPGRNDPYPHLPHKQLRRVHRTEYRVTDAESKVRGSQTACVPSVDESETVEQTSRAFV